LLPVLVFVWFPVVEWIAGVTQLLLFCF